MKPIITFIALLLIHSPSFAANPKVLMETSMGNVTLELDAEKAPITVKNFLSYVNDGSYENTIFHRVIKSFMNQGGGFTPEFVKKPEKAPIQNEADNGLENKRGTIAMARTNAPHSASNQFFINTVDNSFLNHRGKTLRGWGYAVFGKVTQGMDVMDRIAQARTHINAIGRQDVPVEPIIIHKMSVIAEETEEKQQ